MLVSILKARVITFATPPFSLLQNIKYIIHWVVPPPSNSGNEGFFRDSLLKMVHSPGGDWNPGRGDNPNNTGHCFVQLSTPTTKNRQPGPLVGCGKSWKIQRLSKVVDRPS